MTNDELVQLIRGAIAKHGAPQVARLLGLSVEATCRLGGNLPTQAGTRDRARMNAPRLAELDGPRAA